MKIINNAFEKNDEGGFRGAGTTLKLGGGGQTSPGVEGNPYPKLKKTPRIWATIFLVDIDTQVHVQIQTKIKMNDFHSPKLGAGGRRPHSFKVVGASCPQCPPPRFPRPWVGYFL